MWLSGTVPSASAGVVAARVWNRLSDLRFAAQAQPEGRTSLEALSIW